ncbi:MAG TPA: glycosyltransferase family 4 protein [Candidatus Eisenbacteria bacterium]|nr:glycosyltransferase family 4 protein [Candidatus Eisenbacteria bacterium]
MRILFLTSRMPYPPVGGDRFRVYHVMRAAAEAGHAVHLLSFDLGREEQRNGSLDEIARSVETVPLPLALSWFRAAKALPGRFPLQAAYYRSRRMRERVDDAIHRIRPHVVVTHLFRMAPYALPHVGRGRARWILDLTDVISAGIERSMPYRRGLDRKLYEIEGPRIRNYESLIAPRFDECWVISPAEAAELARIAPKATVRVVPNGMGTSRLRASTLREPASLLFLGNLEVFHNRDAASFLARDVFPRVRAEIPGATLAIAGKGSDLVRSWAERLPGVRVLGFVEDADQVISRASVFVAPHRFAAGVQNKVLQALSCATPVVTTSVVRAGLEPVPEGVIRVADDPEHIAAHVVALLRDPDGANAFGHLGRAWVQSRFTWEPSVLALEAGLAVHPRRDAEKPFAAALRS